VGDRGLNTHRAPVGQLGQLARRCTRHIEHSLVFIAGSSVATTAAYTSWRAPDLGSTWARRNSPMIFDQTQSMTASMLCSLADSMMARAGMEPIP